MNYLTSVQVDELCNLTITLFYSPCGMRIICDKNYPYTFKMKMYIATYSKKRICQGWRKTENLQLPAANVYFSSIRPTYLFVVMFFTTCRTEIIVPLEIIEIYELLCRSRRLFAYQITIVYLSPLANPWLALIFNR